MSKWLTGEWGVACRQDNGQPSPDGALLGDRHLVDRSDISFGSSSATLCGSLASCLSTRSGLVTSRAGPLRPRWRQSPTPPRPTAVPPVPPRSIQRIRWRRPSPSDSLGRFANPAERYFRDPVTAGEEQVDAALEDEASPGAGTEVDGWPVLSDLELEVCVSESTVPGVKVLAPESGEA